MIGVNPVLTATLPWERYDAVMTPCVIELENDVLRMYYSGGESYEPDAIGVAHSYDGGVTWVKHGDPIFFPDPTSKHDKYKVTSPHVIFHDGWYYMFYCGFRGMYTPYHPGHYASHCLLHIEFRTRSELYVPYFVIFGD
jgi:beta-1,2-mannobiose phosphorylase / 1,2-beta-oligomannan phosphorylase